MKGTSKKQERYRAAMERHNEVGHPQGYEGPCWGPTEADFAFVDGVTARGADTPATKEDANE